MKDYIPLIMDAHYTMISQLCQYTAKTRHITGSNEPVTCSQSYSKILSTFSERPNERIFICMTPEE